MSIVTTDPDTISIHAEEPTASSGEDGEEASSGHITIGISVDG